MRYQDVFVPLGLGYRVSARGIHRQLRLNETQHKHLQRKTGGEERLISKTIRRLIDRRMAASPTPSSPPPKQTRLDVLLFSIHVEWLYRMATESGISQADVLRLLIEDDMKPRS